MLFVFLRMIWVVLGAAIGMSMIRPWASSNVELALGAAIGGFLGLFMVLIERAARKTSWRGLFGGAVGLALGIWLSHLIIGSILSRLPQAAGYSEVVVELGGAILFGSLGWVLGYKKGQQLEPLPVRISPSPSNAPQGQMNFLMDTSVIIDGRIADICETGFLQGTLTIPHFILRELQQIADSSDPLKRARGRRGLDILKRMQEMPGVEVRIIDEEVPNVRHVDGKLVELAKQLNVPILTNDFNLNKVAEIQGVKVLNINQLANALKPVVLPGEVMKVKIVKEGKEPGQGVAYLDDGTMVVVDNARKHIGKTLEVTVTSVLQTTAGRMIFTMPKEDADLDHQQVRG
jgi:uncharacterized protein YacL